MIEERELEDIRLQDGEGLFLREEGVEPPSFRKLLKEVGNEEIKSLTIWREPISLNSFKKFLGIKTYYDDLFHLAININGKYNLDKQAVLTFTRGSPKGEKIEIKPPSPAITIQQLIDNTKNSMGKSKYSSYSAKDNNCQDFIMALLQANNLSTEETTKFVKQDTNEIFKRLPKYASLLSDVLTTGQAVINRFQEGEGSYSRINATGLIDMREPTLTF